MEKIPMLKISDLLIVSINNDLNDKVVVSLQNEILDRIHTTKVMSVIIDVSLLDIMDSFLGRVISDTSQMIALLGANVILVGMKPDIAITMVELGLEISSVDTALNLESGIEKLEKKYNHKLLNRNYLNKGNIENEE